MIEFIQNLLANNQFLSGGITVLLVGASLRLLYSFVPFVRDKLYRKFGVTFVVDDDHPFFYLFELFIASKGKPIGSSIYRATAPKNSERFTGVALGKSTQLIKVQGFGYVLYGMSEKETVGAARMRFINITTFGNRDRIDRLLEQVEQFSTEQHKQRTTVSVHMMRQGPGRIVGVAKLSKKRSPVVLQGSLFNDILTDMRWFFDNADNYDEMGISHRRAYLLAGPPGTGKSRLIRDIIAHFPEARATITKFNSTALLEREIGDFDRGKQIIIAEDIDRIATFRDDDFLNDQDVDKGVSFADAINAIDGITSPQNTIFIFTTNHPEKLNPAFMRKGRIDWIINIDPMDEDQVRRMAERFQVTLSDDDIKELVASGITGAELQDKLAKVSPRLRIHDTYFPKEL